MDKTAWIFSYKLKKNVSEEQFIELTQKLHDRQRKRGNRKLLCLYPDEHLQSADFKTCKKILGLNCNTDKPFRTLRKSSRVKNRELRGKP